ncbi:ribonucleoside-triphosphate reductase [Candidatus Bathyarchaeota archaeon]|nr:ribonucleoside-triphosphate reductase [Candidatus Bathyarchaeota archaeon]
MSLNERIIESSGKLPAKFKAQKDGTLTIEFKIAERKVFLTKKTLTYRAKLRVDDENRTVRFFETLKEIGLGISSGDTEDMTPGFGFKKETYKITGKAREANIQELSQLFGKEYKYSFDYSSVRRVVEEEAERAGYSLSTCLLENSV